MLLVPVVNHSLTQNPPLQRVWPSACAYRRSMQKLNRKTRKQLEEAQVLLAPRDLVQNDGRKADASVRGLEGSHYDDPAV